jgi:hypothetical protein
LCPLCNLEGQILNKFWFKEIVYLCKKCDLIYRARSCSEKRNPDLLANYLNDTHKDDKGNGLKLFCNDIFKENLNSKTIILDFGAGSGSITKFEAILIKKNYNKELVQYIALDLDLSGRYTINFNQKLTYFNDLSQVFIFLNSKIKNLNILQLFLIGHHVFEHIEDFNELIIQIKQIPINKTIFLEVPAENQFILRTFIYAILRMPLYYKGHINFFTKKALEKLASNFEMDLTIKTRTLYKNIDLLGDFIDLKESRMLSILAKVLSQNRISKLIRLTYFVKFKNFD